MVDEGIYHSSAPTRPFKSIWSFIIFISNCLSFEPSQVLYNNLQLKGRVIGRNISRHVILLF